MSRSLCCLGAALLFGAIPAVSAAQEAEAPPPRRVLGFVDILREIRGNSPALAAMRAQVDIADGEVDRAWTGWKPNVSAVGSLTFNSLEAVFDVRQLIDPIAQTFGLQIPPGTQFPEPAVIQPHVQLVGVLQATQNLFNMAVLRAPEVAKASRAAAMARVDATEDDLLFQGASLYATLTGLDGMVAASRRALEVAEKRIEDARVQLEAGTTTPLAVTRAETDKVVAEGQLIALEAQRRKLLAGLQVLTGSKEPIAVRSDPIISEGGGGDDWRARTSLRAREAELAAAQKAIGLFNMNWLPSLNARGLLQYANFQGFAGNNFLAQGTINLVIPLYDSGQRYADVKVAEARVRAASRALEQEELQARQFLEDARADLDSAQAEVVQSEAQLRLAAQAVQQAEDLAQAGLATNLDLADADARRYSADRLLAQRRLAQDLATLRLHYAQGGRLAALLEGE